MKNTPITPERIAERILTIRGQRVMLDRDLATLYRVSTFNLNKAVTRNPDRFPADFMFKLTMPEFKALIFHFGISSWGGTRKPPRVFTEQGVAMLSGVLRSKRAAHVNIHIMRTFVKLRQMSTHHKELALKLARLEKRMNQHDEEIQGIFEAIRQLMKSPAPSRKRIGFHP